MTTRGERLSFYLLVTITALLCPAKRLYPKFWKPFFGQILYGATCIGSLNSVRLLLWMQPDIEAREPLNQSTLLMAASSGNQLQVARYLLERGADVNARNAYRDTALMRCAEFSDTKMALLLLEHGAEINASANRGDTAFLAAAKAGKTDMMKLLLDSGADVRASGPGAMDALVWSAGMDHVQGIEFLLQNGMDVFGDRGTLALRLAMRNRNSRIVSLLRQAGASEPA